MKIDQFNSNEDYSDDKFKVLSFTGDKGSFKRLSSSKEAICLLPFDVNENGQIKNVYLAKYHDYVLNGENKRCITTSLEPDEFNTYHTQLLSANVIKFSSEANAFINDSLSSGL